MNRFIKTTTQTTKELGKFILLAMFFSIILIFLSEYIVGNISIGVLQFVNNTVVLCVFSFLSSWRILAKTNKNSTYKVEGNQYGDFYLFFWFILRFVCGYRKIVLTRLPIYTQIYLSKKKYFEFDLKEVNIPIDNEVIVKITKTNFDKIDSDIVNLLVEDTYSITNDNIPFDLRKLPTVRFTRNKVSEHPRVYTDQLDSKVFNFVKHEMSSNVKIVNLLMNTNEISTTMICEKIFMDGSRRTFKYDVYQYNAITKIFIGPVLKKI